MVVQGHTAEIAKFMTRIQSSRIRTARFSGLLWGNGCLPSRGVCQGGVCPGRRLPHNRQTPVKILPCPKLHLWAVHINQSRNNFWDYLRDFLFTKVSISSGRFRVSETGERQPLSLGQKSINQQDLRQKPRENDRN